ncbi:hypothetical protein E2986_06836 [Frieseomelitta varia]|uniref:Uncharacterized protein n=1 Tax=Frieseomelitta varia TaxID=561572 RepID=A0A833RKJ8_9HYME|nr:hypothetical protein E2986_06836 [Frieseomelitta varia]
MNAVTIHEFLAQKAACSLESVDASYPSKVVGQEQEHLSPSVERQSYSEKRKFWEDISRKRESYQRSESEVSRTSQLTTNESDSEYVQNVTTEDTADMVQQMGKSETLEDLNVPDISECSVAEKAQYFEEQIQKETTKLPAKLHQQDSLKSNEREKPTKTKTSDKAEEKADKDEKHVAELKQQIKKTEREKESGGVALGEAEERRAIETKETKTKRSSEDEKEKDESKETYTEVFGREDYAKADEAPQRGSLQLDGVQSVCTQVISTQATPEAESKSEMERVEGETFNTEMTEVTEVAEVAEMAEMAEKEAAEEEKEEEEEEEEDEEAVFGRTLDVPDVPDVTESELLEQKYYVAAGVSSESPEMSVQTSTASMMQQQASMSTSSISGVSIDTVVGKEKSSSDRHSPDSDSFEMVDKPDIIDDFVVIEEVGREAEEYDSEDSGPSK